jgi:hypothetical protein
VVRTICMTIVATTLALLLAAPVAVPALGADPSPATGSFSATGSLDKARSGHTATLLPDGRVLVLGGGPRVGTASESWDPVSGTFCESGSLVEARSRAAARSTSIGASSLSCSGVARPTLVAISTMSARVRTAPDDPRTDGRSDSSRSTSARCGR